MPPRRHPRRHLTHPDEIVLRHVHEAGVRSAFRAGEQAGRSDVIAEERERALDIFAAMRSPELMPMALKMPETSLPAAKVIDILRIAGNPAPSAEAPATRSEVSPHT
ncbi:hypothetical protein GCM10017653_41110 [Ancylobacter defluvii]|uniref:Uncharacterized protein n=2 Tax=Ancylobacter defluvii TaxID=1282440 RepID=A0A9W6JY57_9HYPH|nr:hypothetical protein GCM10017653_41110 [Ancylobacter defluvii]